MYPHVEPQPDLPRLEEKILENWRVNDTFAASVEARPAGDQGANEFVFYDGPPFANGLPHYGHLLTGYVKDAVPRYRTMRGERVERRFGWDCHGLPAEAEAERQLGISGRQAITDHGITQFNDYCRSSVLQYTSEWERYVTRQARWVDFSNDYKTLDLPYMESVMWAFKSLWDKGLVYEGFRVLPYSWALETPLSNSETRLDDAYRDVQDPALTVGFELETGEWLLAWTTTPWTLPSNLALAVGAEITYEIIELHGQRMIIAESRRPAYERELGEAEVVGTITGAELVGRSYRPLFEYFADHPGAFRVLAADFVSVEDGTGVVHLAPGFGEDDQRVCEEHGIELVVPVDSRGRFTAEVVDFEGLMVFDANPEVIRALKDRGRVIRHETYDHSYPHCWRTGTPLIYKAVSSWFVQVTSIKERMLELNNEIRWVPEHLREGSFGKWLANARDWTISRNRFWGAPIPVWQSDDPQYPRTDVYGSIAELERDFGSTVTDLHRPAIDDLVRPNPDDPTGISMMRRVPEVLDCWFESGAMPFAQVHYPFENREWFENHYPGDFIVEYIGQTRGWFYTMHVLATALFDRPAFSTCVSHGVVLGDDGQKMSKSLRNYPDPMAIFETYGADAMRWYLLSSTILRGADFSVTEVGIRDTVRQVILPYWNAWYFLTLYANAADTVGVFRTDQSDVLDRYLLGELHELVTETTSHMDAYDLYAASVQISRFLETLTNWYIRRSRDRFWAGDQDAIDTLHTALVTLSQVAAPLLPLVAESVYLGLTGGSEDAADSVHLSSWPDAGQFPVDEDLRLGMSQVRDACSALLALRKSEGLRVRLPLASATIASPHANLIAPHIEVVRDELNVKEIHLTDEVSRFGTPELKLNPGRLGPRLGDQTQVVIRAYKAGDWQSDGERVTVGGVDLEPGEYDYKLVASTGGAAANLPGGNGIVVLDTQLSPELEIEGRARDLIRSIQQARRTAGLDVSDRIALVVTADGHTLEALSIHKELVAAETLALSVSSVEADVAEPEIMVTRVADAERQNR
jgi:isoleucyl-tRNA synthetase